VQFFSSFSEFPEEGVSKVIYVDESNGAMYIWDPVTDAYIIYTDSGSTSLAYGSFFDTTDQSVSSNQIAAMKFGVTDFSSGVSVTNDLLSNPTQITIAANGKYNIQFSAQLYRVAGGSGAHARIWLRKNGADISDTTTVVHFGNNNVYSVAAWNFFVDANAGDKYQIMWTQDDAITIAHEEENTVIPYPAVPSVILTVNQVGYV
jgi:hypothetical protein